MNDATSSNEESVTVKPIITQLLFQANPEETEQGDRCRFYDAVSSSAKFEGDEMSSLLGQLETVCPNAPARYLFQEQTVDNVRTAFGNVPSLSTLRFHLDNILEICEPEMHPSVDVRKVSSETVTFDSQSSSMLPLPFQPCSLAQESKVVIYDAKVADFYTLSVQMDLQKCQELNRESLGRFNNDVYVRAKRIRLSSFHFQKVHRQRAEASKEHLDKLFTLRDSTALDAFGDPGDNRKQAMELYKAEMTKLDRGVRVEECGLVVNPTCSYLSASADGQVLDPSFEQPHGLVKIIFPIKYRNISLFEAVTKNDFCSSIDSEKKIFLKKSHAYYSQIQGLLALSGLEWCDLVLVCKGGITIERVFKDDQHFYNLFGKLTHFYFTKCLPYLTDMYAN